MLLAVCNAKYEFIMVDIGDSGRQSGGSVYNNSQLRFSNESNALNLPDPDIVVSNPENVLAYVFVADVALGLKCHTMNLYPDQKIASDERVNHRRSRGRIITENAFGIASSRFQIFCRPIIAITDKVILSTKAV